MLTEIKRTYTKIHIPYKLFSERPANILTKKIDFVTDNFIQPNKLPIMTLIDSTTEIDYDALAFNLFRFQTLLERSYSQYNKIINGFVALDVIKDNFKHSLDFPENAEIKLTLVSSGTYQNEVLAVYAIEFLTSKVPVQCFSVLEVANYSLPTPEICIYNGQGVTFSGNPPMSPLNLVLQYTQDEWRNLHSPHLEDLVSMLIPITPKPFSKNLVGETKFNNNLAGLQYRFPRKENFSPLVMAKSLGVKIGNLFMDFKSQKQSDQIKTNKNSDAKIRQVIDEVFDYFPEDLQFILIGSGSAVILIIMVILIAIKCNRTLKDRQRKKRERNQIRTVNFLSAPLRPRV